MRLRDDGDASVFIGYLDEHSHPAAFIHFLVGKHLVGFKHGTIEKLHPVSHDPDGMVEHMSLFDALQLHHGVFWGDIDIKPSDRDLVKSAP